MGLSTDFMHVLSHVETPVGPEHPHTLPSPDHAGRGVTALWQLISCTGQCLGQVLERGQIERMTLLGLGDKTTRELRAIITVQTYHSARIHDVHTRKPIPGQTAIQGCNGD